MSLTIKKPSVSLRILSTSDLHAHLIDFDYNTLQASEKFGLTRTATLIKNARQEKTNVLLIDNGDLIQGSPLGCLYADTGLNDKEIHPIIETLNYLQFDAATLGNHEFNYGLAFLSRVIKDANYPIVNANVLNYDTHKPYFTPYAIKPTHLIDDNGDSVTINIGYIGFLPPQILLWDKQHLDKKVYAEDIIVSAKKWIPKMKMAGADLIIAMNHSGLSADEYVEGMENPGYYLSEIPGIDVIIAGHSHQVFPSENFLYLANTNLTQGVINGKPVTMPGYFGSHLGVIDILLEHDAGVWHIKNTHAQARPIYDEKLKRSLVCADEVLMRRLASVHQRTIEFVSRPIGHSNQPLYSHLALIQDSHIIQLINDAQMDFFSCYLEEHPEIESLPILSAASAFKAGGKDSYALSYCAIDEGCLTYRNASDIYPFPNSLTVVKVNGDELKDWLEYAAGIFSHIQANLTTPQYLINYAGFKTYNFDIIDGVNYSIDVFEPCKFDGEGRVINPNASRIKGLTYQNKLITKDDYFYVVTNNYRGYSGKVKGTGSEKVVINLPRENRTVLIDYIRKKTAIDGTVNIDVDFNWQLLIKVDGYSPDIRFVAPSVPKVTSYIKEHARFELQYVQNINYDLMEYKLL